MSQGWLSYEHRWLRRFGWTALISLLALAFFALATKDFSSWGVGAVAQGIAAIAVCLIFLVVFFAPIIEGLHLFWFDRARPLIDRWIWLLATRHGLHVVASSDNTIVCAKTADYLRAVQQGRAKNGYVRVPEAFFFADPTILETARGTFNFMDERVVGSIAEFEELLPATSGCQWKRQWQALGLIEKARRLYRGTEIRIEWLSGNHRKRKERPALSALSLSPRASDDWSEKRGATLEGAYGYFWGSTRKPAKEPVKSRCKLWRQRVPQEFWPAARIVNS